LFFTSAIFLGGLISSGVTTGLSQGGQNVTEGGLLVTAGAHSPKLRKNVKKWWWISGCRRCPY